MQKTLRPRLSINSLRPDDLLLLLRRPLRGLRQIEPEHILYNAFNTLRGLPFTTWARVSMAKPEEMAHFVRSYKKLYG